MTQTAIPFLFMRGGTSRGPYIRREDLPQDQHVLARVLAAALGSGHPLNIDGIGGGNAVTTKVAMLSRSQDDWADIDYFFAQVSVDDQGVDFKPTCGNILIGVGSAAIEMGLMSATGPTTELRIRAINTGAKVISVVQTPDCRVEYAGNTRIDGVPGSAAPVALQFMETVGGVTGAFLPTGNLRDQIDGIEVTCMDVAMPMVIARASEFGLSGYESADDLNKNRAFLARMEAVRIKAGAAMGMGDVSASVTPKFGLMSPARAGGTIATRYFMPWQAHPAMAVTGAQCLAACALTPGTIATGMADLPQEIPAPITLEHASGSIDVLVNYQIGENGFSMISASLTRTARLLARGELYVPRAIWAGV